jgi:hypothetical protein
VMVRSIVHAQTSHCSQIYFPILIRASLTSSLARSRLPPPLYTRISSFSHLYMNTNTDTYGQQVHIWNDTAEMKALERFKT